MSAPVRSLRKGKTSVEIYETSLAASVAAADKAAEIMARALEERNHSRIIVGTGNSQAALIDALLQVSGLSWRNVEVFHMDEYVGISDAHSASFRRWLREHIAERTDLDAVRYLNADEEDLVQEADRYAALLSSGPIDVAFVGFGENGHIAFNDPHVANFQDPETVKVVELDEMCRSQQVGEGHFASMDVVPKNALTLTCPALMGARHIVSCVPDKRKAAAVRDAIEGPLTTECPASLVFTHPRAYAYLDVESASLLTE